VLSVAWSERVLNDPRWDRDIPGWSSFAASGNVNTFAGFGATRDHSNEAHRKYGRKMRRTASTAERFWGAR
jgi:hypothetical protein